MTRALMLLVLLAIGGPASAQMPTLGYGAGSFSTVSIAACGTGVISMATGCTTVLLLGLVP
jgi:hypothetical protein